VRDTVSCSADYIIISEAISSGIAELRAYDIDHHTFAASRKDGAPRTATGVLFCMLAFVIQLPLFTLGKCLSFIDPNYS
jgi:hypothetical protein